MVHIVAALPPSNRQATAEVADEDTDQRVYHEVVGDSSVAGVMCCEHDLLLYCDTSARTAIATSKVSYPEASEKASRRGIQSVLQADDEQCEENTVSGELFGIFRVATVVVAFLFHALMQGLVLELDVLLRGGIQGRRVTNASIDCLLYDSGSVGLFGLIDVAVVAVERSITSDVDVLSHLAPLTTGPLPQQQPVVGFIEVNTGVATC